MTDWGGYVPPHALVLLGASPIFSGLSDWGKKSGVPVTIMTSPDQAPSLRQIGVAAKVFGHFDEEAEKLLPHVQEPWVAISFGARWIFSESLLYGVTAFAGRLLNAHGTRLPMDRGGGGFSWRVMRGDRIGCLLLHKMTREIDAGPIVAFEDYLIPRALQTSAEIGADYERRQLPFVISYLEKGAPIESLAQPTYSSGYFPRLHTPTHAWIDWAWAPEEIERFILAFDDPYPGARTY